MKKIKFLCPHCKMGDKIDVTDYGAVVVTRLLGAEDDGYRGLVYDQNSHEIIDGAEIVVYACEECGEVIHEGTDSSFYEYLETNGLIGEEMDHIKEENVITVDGAIAYYDKGHGCLMLERIPPTARIYVNGKEASIPTVAKSCTRKNRGSAMKFKGWIIRIDGHRMPSRYKTIWGTPGDLKTKISGQIVSVAPSSRVNGQWYYEIRTGR